MSRTRQKLALLLGMFAIAWLALLVSSHGVLVHSALVRKSLTVEQQRFPDGVGTWTVTGEVLRCTYFVATTLRSIDVALIDQTRCSRFMHLGR